MNEHHIYRYHVIIEAVGYLFNMLAVVYAVVLACTVEGEVPVHFDITGQADAYGPASYMLIEPLIMLAGCILISLMAHFLPEKYYNTGFKVRPGHEAKVYADFITMVVLLIPVFGLFSLLETLLCNRAGSIAGVSILTVFLAFADIIGLFIKAYLDNRE